MLVTIHGQVDPQFDEVKAVFADLWQEIEVGASLCVFHGGIKVVDLWGGFTDRKMSEPWQADTLVNVYSATKGIASLAMAILMDEGKVSYEDKVVKYWPEFGAEGKHTITIAQLLSHQAGLCGVDEKLTVRDLYDWQKMVNLLASQKPLWEPGKSTGYHAVTWGYFPGELIRRVTGKTLVEYYNEKVQQPLVADFFIGLPESEFHRCAPLIGPNYARQFDPLQKETLKNNSMRKTKGAALSTLSRSPELYAKALLNPVISPFKDACSRPWRKAELAASNGHASARGIATVYAAMAMQGKLNGTRIISQQALMAATQLETARSDLVLGKVIRRSAGFILNTDQAYGPNENAFGHSGSGGSMGFADQKSEIALGYVMNQMHTDALTVSRSKRLTDAVYRCIGSL